MDAKIVCQEYSSSLEDLTFNSKPLINMLTMLAEENSQHAAGIIKLIEKRIYEVTIDKKLPALYLMDSIVKNIGKEYITSVAPSIVALFTHVFGKGDEKVRLSLYKLRNTWSTYFAANKLHEIDCSIHKLDPGWPVVDPPPPSPSIHINPKFLPKVEENIETKASSSHEVQIREDFQKKQEELEQLQGEQMRLQLMQLEELQLKHDLIKKKQEQERQELIKQQQEKILQMRLQEENITSTEEIPADTQKTGTSAEATKNVRDPRLKKIERIGNEARTTVSVENTNDKGDVKEENIESKVVERVGFDTEFVPLDKSSDDSEPTKFAYNRDRALGKKRYFTGDSIEQKTKNISNTEPTSTNVNVTEPKQTRTHEEKLRGKNRRGNIQRSDTVLSKDKTRNSSAIAFEKEHAEENRKNSRREQNAESKGKGWERDSRKITSGRRGNETEKRIRARNRGESKEGLPDGTQAKFARRDDWNRGRGHKRPRRGQRGQRGMAERHGRHRHEFPPQNDNPDRLLEAPPRNWLPDPSQPFERVAMDEPPDKRGRPSSPRPLFSEREITEIRERHHGSPPRGFPHNPPRDYDGQSNPDWHIQDLGLEPRFHEQWRHEGPHEGVRPEYFERPFHDDVAMTLPRFPHPDGVPLPPHTSQYIPPEFNRHFAGGVEIPLELTLDNESEILRSAERRLSMGDLSEEQHNELLEKLHQLYELQKWQRRHSLSLEHEPQQPLPPQLPLHPPGGPLHPPGGVLHPPGGVLHLAGGPPPRDRESGTVTNNQGFNDRPMDNIVSRDPLPGVFDHQPTTETIGGDGRTLPQGEQRVIENQNAPSDLEPLAVKGEPESESPPSNLIMEKQTVDDLFKRLMEFDIIKKVNEEPSDSPGRSMTPPVSLETTEIPIPEITLTMGSLRRRYDGVIIGLYRGTQCSSCGLRFKDADNTTYRQHLDWHFRMNRKEKETAAAHRNWFITIDDWLDFESSEDPKLKARSSVFEADSEDESENSEEEAPASCPVLRDDTESETACDICLEKFEQFWDETTEEWHYKSAVRIDGKTYHYLCYQDAKEAENVDDDTEATNEKEDGEKHDSVDSETRMEEEVEESRTEDDNKDISSNNDKTLIVTEIVGSAIEGEQGIIDANNKEEKKIECS